MTDKIGPKPADDVEQVAWYAELRALANLRANERVACERRAAAREAAPVERKIMTGAGFLALESPETPWRVFDLVPRVGLGLILGAEKSGKSLLSLQLCLALAAEHHAPGSVRAFLGQSIHEGCPTLYIEEEGGQGFLQYRLRRQLDALGLTDAPPSLYIMHRQAARLDDPEFLQWLDEQIGKVGAKLVIVGPIAQVADLKDENASVELNAIYRNLNPIATRHECAIALMHHRRKPNEARDAKDYTIREFFNQARGTNASMAAIDFAIGIQHDPEDADGRLYVILRDGPAYKSPVKMETTLTFSKSAIEPQRLGRSVNERELLGMIDRLKQGATIANLTAQTTASVSSVRRAITDLTNDGLIQFTTGPRGTKFYSLTERARAEVAENAHPLPLRAVSSEEAA